ncbi:RraA family protein (plasmid) [Rhizobium sp. NIBRBAC000502774]|nr:RraA family protein [Rhizobium sp. NIBRBAC000502774]
MSLGFRIINRGRSVAEEWIEKFRDIPVANISDVMGRLGAGGATLRPVHGAKVMSGNAVTVRTRPGDNLVVHYAINTAKPGDVIVVDADGDLSNAIVGEMMLTSAKLAGLAGMIINGAVRDSSWIRQNGFPVFAAGITHRGPYKDGPGEVNVPISIGGMVIMPGDLIVGDEDGFVSIPHDQVQKVYIDALQKSRKEQKNMGEILDGTRDRAWVEMRLRSLGCEFPAEV